jgi:ParB family chromosome partitioning protein
MSIAKRGLGRGFASLIPDSAIEDVRAPSERPQFRLVPIDEIQPNPQQPRQIFDPAELRSLSDSIRSHGVLSPLVVRRHEGHYVLVAGERRLRASALAGLREVPVVVREVDEPSVALELALVENLQRTDLDPIEAARGYQQLMDQYGYTQDEVAQRVGKERPTIANALRLLRLPEFVLDALRAGHLSAGHARALLPLSDEAELRRLVARILAQDLSVRATERIVAQLTKGPAPKDPPSSRERGYEYATRLLADALHTKVAIRARKNGSGQIVIDYADLEELDRLIESIRAERPAPRTKAGV